MIYARYHSPLGYILLSSADGFLTGLNFEDQIPPEQSFEIDASTHPVIQETFQWLDAYFAGNQPSPALLPLRPAGSPFQRSVWQMLLRIPYGETITYGQLAKHFPGKMSAQAVGQAVGRNPISIIIPCHRVLGSDNHLTGYAGGIDNKVWLLTHEGHSENNFKYPKKHRGK